MPARPQFLLWGNIHDHYLIGDEPVGDDSATGVETARLLDLSTTIRGALKRAGYRGLIQWDPTSGLVPPNDDDELRQFKEFVGDIEGGRRRHSDTNQLAELVERVAVEAASDQLWGLVVQRASRLCRAPASLSDSEHELFTRVERAIDAARLRRADGDRGDSLVFNPVFWVTERDGDLPPWFLHRIREVAIPLPDTTDLDRGARLYLQQDFWGFSDASEVERSTAHRTYLGLVQGLRLKDLVDINRLARAQGFTLAEVDDAVRSYRAGVRDNPWRRGHLLAQISTGQETLGKRVLGQPVAVQRALDLLKRSAMGLSGAHAGSSSGRPRGVLFFAGPTGVGKTELAKALTELVFGDADAYVRFDMSEFRNEGADQRLIGAPPGYVGHEAGGELTSAVRTRPFSLVLFDEIEKANSTILDKFLQVLEDGRLTDGRGDTVNFSETLIVFTSNKGVIDQDGQPTVSVDDTYDTMANIIEGRIRDFFTSEIQRPELLNRLGENIVVFDFIRDDAARKIFDVMLDRVLDRVQVEHRVSIRVESGVREEIFTLCWTNPLHGGRGIGNQIERIVTEPLARQLFDQWSSTDGQTADALVLRGIRDEGHTYRAELDVVG